MPIPTKLDINQTGYAIYYDKEKIKSKKCKYCDENGMVKIKGDKFKCPSCDGISVTEKYKRTFEIRKFTVTRIQAEMYVYTDFQEGCVTNVKYIGRDHLNDRTSILNTIVHEKHIFRTKLKAEELLKEKGKYKLRKLFRGFGDD